MTEAVVVAAARSAFGKAGRGALRDVRPDDLLAATIAGALAQVPSLDPALLDDLLVGCAVPTDEHGDNIARRVGVMLGRDDVPGVSVNRFCASSVQTTRMAMHAIRSGEGRAFVSAGVDCASRYLPSKMDRNQIFDAAGARTAARNEATWTDPRLEGLLPDVYISMGETAENVAGRYGVSRREQDEYALLSQQRTGESLAAGYFDREIVPVTVPDGTVVDRDDCPRLDASLERMSALTPVFREHGTVTAANACPLNDGAAALIVVSDDLARDLGIRPLARVVATSATGLSPEIMGMGPVSAITRVLELAGMTTGDVDLFEINEAFAAQVIPCVRELDLDMDKVNVHGGAIAIGHPFGATGARLIGTVINGLGRTGGTIGVVSMCVAGGQGMAVVLERMS